MLCCVVLCSVLLYVWLKCTAAGEVCKLQCRSGYVYHALIKRANVSSEKNRPLKPLERPCARAELPLIILIII